jgi:NCS1 family nucleobase:cation symporter-1
MEKVGVEQVSAEARHGRLINQFTLWLGANLTIADYGIGIFFVGVPLQYVVLAIVVGNAIGGLLLGLMASMGPTFGRPQMMISRAAFGKNGNLPFALANWISTVGWFTVNTILGSFALNVAFGIPFYVGALILIVVQVLIATYGHDVIHGFERVVSIVLAVMFAVVSALALSQLKFHTVAYTGAFDPYVFALLLAVVFSYLMSWSPYASDYSRYLPSGTSKLGITVAVFAGGAIASAWLEVIGALVYASVGTTNVEPITALAQTSGNYASFALAAIVLGAVAANALNLYTNSLSALVIYGGSKRVYTVILAGVVGFAFALYGGTNFQLFYQNFLLTLDYWITPWIGIMLAFFFVRKMTGGVEGAKSIEWIAIASYLIGLGVSVPFMNLTSYGISFEGPLAAAFQGVDVSYFVSFGGAVASYLLLTVRRSQTSQVVQPR